MEVSISLPLDAGFLRRECPHCRREFKWRDGSDDDESVERASPPLYYCPYCGEPAGLDDWWTQAQLDYAMAMAAGPAMREVTGEFKAMAKGQSRGLIEFSAKADPPPELPPPLVEPFDMTQIESPCHALEPLKVDEAWGPAFHCLVCGEPFSV